MKLQLTDLKLVERILRLEILPPHKLKEEILMEEKAPTDKITELNLKINSQNL